METPEHGRLLQEKLPGWHLVHGGCPRVDQQHGPALSLAASYRTIVTLVAAAHQVTFAPNVLIVAMGGGWIFDLPSPVADELQGLVVVEVADDFDALAQTATCHRLRAYAARGWQVEAPGKWQVAWPQFCFRKQNLVNPTAHRCYSTDNAHQPSQHRPGAI